MNRLKKFWRDHDSEIVVCVIAIAGMSWSTAYVIKRQQITSIRLQGDGTEPTGNVFVEITKRNGSIKSYNMSDVS